MNLLPELLRFHGLFGVLRDDLEDHEAFADGELLLRIDVELLGLWVITSNLHHLERIPNRNGLGSSHAARWGLLDGFQEPVFTIHLSSVEVLYLEGLDVVRLDLIGEAFVLLYHKTAVFLNILLDSVVLFPTFWDVKH